jgi:hypothetical protein
VAPAVVKIPLDQYVVSTSKATGATVFRPSTLTEEKGVDLEAIRTVRGDVGAGTDDYAVFDVGLYVKDSANSQVSISKDHLAVNRRTADGVACCVESVDGTPTRHEGLTYKFPFGTEKKTYPYFDITARKTYPIVFKGIGEIDGLEVYQFEMTAAPVKIGSIELPGRLMGSTAPTVSADRFYSNIRTLWVEPDSGVIVRGREQQKQTFRDAAGADKVTIIQADVQFTDKTVASAATVAKDTRSKIFLVTVVAPLALGIAGVLLGLLGIALVVIRPRPRSAHRLGSSNGERVRV